MFIYNVHTPSKTFALIHKGMFSPLSLPASYPLPLFIGPSPLIGAVNDCKADPFCFHLSPYHFEPLGI